MPVITIGPSTVSLSTTLLPPPWPLETLVVTVKPSQAAVAMPLTTNTKSTPTNPPTRAMVSDSSMNDTRICQRL
jgi:hypothetical protein